MTSDETQINPNVCGLVNVTYTLLDCEQQATTCCVKEIVDSCPSESIIIVFITYSKFASTHVGLGPGAHHLFWFFLVKGITITLPPILLTVQTIPQLLLLLLLFFRKYMDVRVKNPTNS